ncbi:MAG TPA: rRNA maturation RNase YbeY, partial [Vampirovibrionales bacterium]
MSQDIQFFSEQTDFVLPKQSDFSEWISRCISKKGKSTGSLNFIFCSDEYLLTLNKEYLNHDTYTDIITFNYVEEEIISGDIFISIDRVRENASALNIDFNEELSRVIIHGVLHLIGYRDKTPEEAQ